MKLLRGEFTREDAGIYPYTSFRVNVWTDKKTFCFTKVIPLDDLKSVWDVVFEEIKYQFDQQFKKEKE